MTQRNDTRTPRTYSKEQRKAAMMALLAGESAEQVAARLDIHLGTMTVWWTEARRGVGSCAEIYKSLSGRVEVDLSDLQVLDILRRQVHNEVVRLRLSGPEDAREKLATSLFDLSSATGGVVSLSRPQADAVVSMLVDRVFQAVDPAMDTEVGRLAIAALRLQRA